MNRKALVLVLAALAVGGATFAVTYNPQERERKQERREGQERHVERERPAAHALGVALEMQKKLELSPQQIKQLEDIWAEFRPARDRHRDHIAELRVAYRETEGEKRQQLANQIEGSQAEFNNWSERLAGQVFEIVGPDRAGAIRETLQEINGRNRERCERPRVHPLGMALEMQKKLGLRDDQLSRFQAMWAEYKAAKAENDELLQSVETQFAKLRERSAREQEYGAVQQRATAARQEFASYSESVTKRVLEMLGPDQRDMLRAQLREINARRERGRERPRVHPLAMALEHQRDLGLRENQVKRMQDMWAEYKKAKADNDEFLKQMERQFGKLAESGVGEARLKEVQQRSAVAREEFGAYSERLAGQLNEILGGEQREMLGGLMRRHREGGRERERGLVNPMNGHSMAWALELHEKLGLTEKQVARLKEAYGDLRAEGKGLNERQAGIHARIAALKEAGRWTDSSAKPLNDAIKRIGMAREEIQAKASEIVADTLNKEQLAVLRKIMDENSKNDG